jgi:hypothetical protein
MTIRMCIAGVGCFAGLFLIQFAVSERKEGLFVPGVILGGVGLAMLLRFGIDLLAMQINNLKQDS